MTARIYLLIKVFDKEEYADAFIQKGELFCRTLGDFKRIENDVARGETFTSTKMNIALLLVLMGRRV